MGLAITLIVTGKPEPRGSKVPIVLYDRVLDSRGRVVPGHDGKPRMKPRLDKHGRVILFPKDDNPRSGPWMKKVAKAAIESHGRLMLRGPVRLSLFFYLQRPQYHFGTGRNAGQLKPRFYDVRPTVRPDRLKLARAIEDALTGVLYVDDSQTVAGPVEKHYAAPGSQPRVEIEITPLAAMAAPSARKTEARTA